jgi:uncharacterized protein YodC (DUF2158 family)
MKVGDVVQLKSGGPKMTIEETFTSGFAAELTKIKCIWMNDEGEVLRAEFPPELIMLATS